MPDLNVTIGGEGSVQIGVTESNFKVALLDTEYAVGLAEYGGYGPRGLQGNVGPPGTTTATDINVDFGNVTVNLQSAITSLSTLFFQQSAAPTLGVSEGDLWYDTTESVLKVYQNAVWVTVIAQPNLAVATLDAGYF
jgi:hypothetical protein